MGKDEDAGWGGALVLLAIVVCLSFMGGLFVGNWEAGEFWKKKAVNDGFARWTADQHGGVKWEWIPR